MLTRFRGQGESPRSREENREVLSLEVILFYDLCNKEVFILCKERYNKIIKIGKSVEISRIYCSLISIPQWNIFSSIIFLQ